MASPDPRRALVFGALADEYARWRPTYPDEAVDWLIGNSGSVADVGAGTGQLTGQMLERGLIVHVVEPDARMLAVLQRTYPSAYGHESTADRLPLLDSSVDAVLSADAWHWFPVEETMKEVRRVLRPGGWLGLVWNTVTPVERWEYELAGIDGDTKGIEHDDQPEDDNGWPFPAEETTVQTFPWVWEVTPEHFRAYLATNSGVMTLDPHQRKAKLDSARAVVARACADLGTSTAPMHHQAYCLRWQPA